MATQMQFWSLRTELSGEGAEDRLVSFERVHQYQLELLDQRIRGEIPDTVLFVEHPPTITRGRGLQRKEGEPSRPAMPLLKQMPKNWAYHEIERGGDLTFHGPGQLVVYPILKLDGSGFAPDRDLGKFLRLLEQVFIDELCNRGLRAGRSEGATGIWISGKLSDPAPKEPLKIASIGIALRKWVSFHGIALNVVNRLEDFSWISPCGFSPRVMTRLCDLGSQDWKVPGDWRSDIETAVARRMGGSDAVVVPKLVK